MGPYIGIFKMNFKSELQYRAKALSGVATQFFWGIMYIFLYTAFLNVKSVSGFSFSQMATYIWLGQAFFALRYVGMPTNADKEIVNGDVCYKFVRPVEIYNQWFAEYFGEKLSTTLLRCIPILIICLFLPLGYGLSAPVSFVAFLLFIVSLFLGMTMSVTIAMFAVFLSFKTLSPKGAKAIVFIIAGLFNGMFIPLPLMPLSIQNVINWLPFRYISDFSFRIYMGNVDIKTALIQLCVGIVWLIIMIIFGKLLINKSLKKTIIQGG